VLKRKPVADGHVSMTVHVDALPLCMPTRAHAQCCGQQSTFISCAVAQAGLEHVLGLECVLGLEHVLGLQHVVGVYLQHADDHLSGDTGSRGDLVIPGAVKLRLALGIVRHILLQQHAQCIHKPALSLHQPPQLF